MVPNVKKNEIHAIYLSVDGVDLKYMGRYFGVHIGENVGLANK